MSAIARRVERDGGEIHVATGHGESPAGTEHWPAWSEWEPDTGLLRRQCRHPDCDLDEYQGSW